MLRCAICCGLQVLGLVTRAAAQTTPEGYGLQLWFRRRIPSKSVEPAFTSQLNEHAVRRHRPQLATIERGALRNRSTFMFFESNLEFWLSTAVLASAHELSALSGCVQRRRAVNALVSDVDSSANRSSGGQISGEHHGARRQRSAARDRCDNDVRASTLIRRSGERRRDRIAGGLRIPVRAQLAPFQIPRTCLRVSAGRIDGRARRSLLLHRRRNMFARRSLW
jgi:hypothetical protein